MNVADVVVVGGGFYGLRLALFAREELGADRVVVLEREDAVMQRASYANQARVHRGYHYPRSFLTAHRSRVTSESFAREFADAVVADFRHYYAIASQLTKISGTQFEAFCNRIGAPHAAAPAGVRDLFNGALIEAVWEVKEPAFDSRILRSLITARAERAGVEIRTGESVVRLAESAGQPVAVTVSGQEWRAPRVFSAVYSGLNELHARSALPLVPLQHEVTEMVLLRMPDRLRHSAFTVMDGPFFSLTPFPPLGVHALSHVRYTPHLRWADGGGSRRPIPDRAALEAAPTAAHAMRRDVRRYLPAIEEAMVVGSLREVKTVLASSEGNDSRPILVRSDLGLPGYTCILGGKIDNVDDVLQTIASVALGAERSANAR